jgi:hypothetical protein
MLRYYTSELAELHFVLNYSELGIALMQQENLEKRIKGIKMVNDQVKQFNMPIREQQRTRLILLFQKLDLFTLLFSGKYYHSQIVQRSSEILGLYAQERELGEPEVHILWEACLKDESMKVEIY